MFLLHSFAGRGSAAQPIPGTARGTGSHVSRVRQAASQPVTAYAVPSLAAEAARGIPVRLSVSVRERRNCRSDLGQLGSVLIHPSTQPRL